jgi:hypothetical protein
MIEKLIAFGISFLVSLPISILWVYLIDNAQEKTTNDTLQK